MTFSCHLRSWQRHSPSLNQLDFLTETQKVGNTSLQTQIIEMTLKVDQGHWHNLKGGHIAVN